MTTVFKTFSALVIFLANFRVIICASAINVTPTVEIPDGVILGTTNITVSGNTTYFAFRGIPYAQPPTGNLRFKTPVKNSNWTGTYNATYDRCECVQGINPVSGCEDCLYINVYVPAVTNATNLTVMVWIYGGAFIGGNSSYSKFGPDYLLDEGVIFVSFNYRVGVYGFLSTEDLACPGNWGLKDQILALTWVKNNIAHFGGNPDNITVFGQSAGAVSISYLLQAYQNKTKGLFNAAIMQSGQSLCLWGLNVKAKLTAFKIGLALGVITSNTTYLVERLRNVDYELLQTISYTVSFAVMLQNALRGLSFAPVSEPVHDEAVFVNNSDVLLSAGDFNQVPLLIGHNSLEASYVEDITAIMRAYLLLYDVATQDLTPYDLTSSTTIKYLVGFSIRRHYFGILPIAFSNQSIINFISEDQFNRPIRQAVELMSNFTTTYFYVFGHIGLLSGVEDREYYGVGHTEDNSYIFRRDNNYTESDLVTRSRLCRLWTNFAKYSNPTPYEDSLFSNLTWPAVNSTSDDVDYFCINSTLSVQQNPNQDDWEYYEDLYDTYGDGNYTTY